MESLYKIAVIESFKELRKALDDLEDKLCVQDKQLPCWFAAPASMQFEENLTPRQKLFLFLNQLEYLDKQEPREILLGPGILACSKATLATIIALNQAKDKFKQAVIHLKRSKLKKHEQNLDTEFETILGSRNRGINGTLKKIGFPRLHLKQCYRRIVILNKIPKKITWTWANTKSIKKITVAQAEQLLRKVKQDAGIQYQLNKLLLLGQSENLAIVQDYLAS